MSLSLGKTHSARMDDADNDEKDYVYLLTSAVCTQGEKVCWNRGSDVTKA